MEVFLKISFESLPKEISLTKIEKLIRKLLGKVDTCDICSLSFTASPINSYVYYANLVLHTSDRCRESDIVNLLQSIEKVYAEYTEIVNAHNGASVFTLNVAVSEDLNSSSSRGWYPIIVNYDCKVMTRLNQNYACPYILENDNATEMYEENGIALNAIADMVTSTDGTRTYRVCLSEIAIKNVATQIGNKLKWVITVALALFIGIC